MNTSRPAQETWFTNRSRAVKRPALVAVFTWLAVLSSCSDGNSDADAGASVGVCRGECTTAADCPSVGAECENGACVAASGDLVAVNCDADLACQVRYATMECESESCFPGEVCIGVDDEFLCLEDASQGAGCPGVTIAFGTTDKEGATVDACRAQFDRCVDGFCEFRSCDDDADCVNASLGNVCQGGACFCSDVDACLSGQVCDMLNE